MGYNLYTNAEIKAQASWKLEGLKRANPVSMAKHRRNNFLSEAAVRAKLHKYGLDNPQTLQKKLKALGIDIDLEDAKAIYQIVLLLVRSGYGGWLISEVPALITIIKLAPALVYFCRQLWFTPVRFWGLRLNYPVRSKGAANLWTCRWQ